VFVFFAISLAGVTGLSGEPDALRALIKEEIAEMHKLYK